MQALTRSNPVSLSFMYFLGEGFLNLPKAENNARDFQYTVSGIDKNIGELFLTSENRNIENGETLIEGSGKIMAPAGFDPATHPLGPV